MEYRLTVVITSDDPPDQLVRLLQALPEPTVVVGQGDRQQRNYLVSLLGEKPWRAPEVPTLHEPPEGYVGFGLCQSLLDAHLSGTKKAKETAIWRIWRIICMALEEALGAGLDVLCIRCGQPRSSRCPCLINARVTRGIAKETPFYTRWAVNRAQVAGLRQDNFADYNNKANAATFERIMFFVEHVRTTS